MAKYLDSDGLLYFWQKIKNTFASASDIPSAGTTSPKMDGTASAGSATAYAREDHVHPKDTSKANLASPTFTGTPKAPTAAAGTNTTQIATTAFVKTAVDNVEYTHPSYDAATAAAVKIGRDATGHVVIGAALTASDVGASASSHTHTGANVVSWLGNTAVNRATADASGNNIADTYAKKTDLAGMYKYKGSVADDAHLPTTGQSTGDVYNIESAGAYGGAGANVAWNGSAWDSLGEIFTIASITNSEIDTIVAS